MKTKILLPVVLLTVVLCGCKPAPKNIAAKNPEMLQATNFETITGGFGWKLGQTISTNQDLSYETNGTFSIIVLSVNTNWQLCTITGCTPPNHPLPPDDFKALLKALAEKYGYLGNAQQGDGMAYVFGAPNSVVVHELGSMTEISYVSHDLATELKKQKEDAAAKTFKNY